MSKTTQLSVLAAAAVIGIAYLVAPDMVRYLLHWWQPHWF